jgi:hypothetical protein
MRKIILSTVTLALIAASMSQASAAQPQHHRKTQQVTSDQFRAARNAVEQQNKPAWPYSGWSAPASR